MTVSPSTDDIKVGDRVQSIFYRRGPCFIVHRIEYWGTKEPEVRVFVHRIGHPLLLCYPADYLVHCKPKWWERVVLWLKGYFHVSLVLQFVPWWKARKTGRAR